MKQVLLAALLVLPVATVWSATERSVSVQAEAYVEAVPDTLQLQLSVKKTASSLAEAQAQVASIAAQVVQLARTNGVAADDIDSSQVSAYPEYEWRKQVRIYVGESAVRNIKLKLRDLDKYGELIRQLSNLELEHINGPTMSHSNIDQLRLDALRKALAKGQRKAEIIARQLGVKLGKILWVNEAGTAVPAPRAVMRAQMAMAEPNDGGSGGFSYARQRIPARAEMRFELK